MDDMNVSYNKRDKKIFKELLFTETVTDSAEDGLFLGLIASIFEF